MKSKLGCVFQHINDELIFSLYEVSDELDHHHRVILKQCVSYEEIDELISEFELIVSRLQEWKGILKDDVEKHECKWCGGIGVLYTSKDEKLSTEECKECEGKGFYTVES